jgi:hypothetical protein
LSPAGRRQYLNTILAQDFSVFIRKVFETVSPGDEFLSNWHVDAMTFAAEGVIDGKLKRLITTVPPRHLKSIIFSVALPAFLLGQDPTKGLSASATRPILRSNMRLISALWSRRNGTAAFFRELR